MAETAAFFIWEGAGKSGKPSARLIALHRWARCESSWMGDGVKVFATEDSFSSIYSEACSLLLWCVPYLNYFGGELEASVQNVSCQRGPVWTTKNHHSISITHHSSLNFSHPFAFITQFPSLTIFHTIWRAHACHSTAFFFFFQQLLLFFFSHLGWLFGLGFFFFFN